MEVVTHPLGDRCFTKEAGREVDTLQIGGFDWLLCSNLADV